MHGRKHVTESSRIGVNRSLKKIHVHTLHKNVHLQYLII